MKLLELKSLLKQHRTIALKEICEWLNLEKATAKQMLQHFIQQGSVEKLAAGTPCKGCSLCPTDQIELYRWVSD